MREKTQVVLSLPLSVALVLLAFAFGRYWDDMPDLPEVDETDRIPSPDEKAEPPPGISFKDLDEFKPGMMDGHEVRSKAYPVGHLPGMPMDLPQRSPLQTTTRESDQYISAVPFQVLSWHPRVVYYPGFANNTVCEEIVNMASSQMGLSSSGQQDERNLITRETTLAVAKTKGQNFQESPNVLAWVEEKIARATLLPVNSGEPFNVKRHGINQREEFHYDALDHSYGPQSSQRIATFLLFLSDWRAGGQVVFPGEGMIDLDKIKDLVRVNCPPGLKVKPTMGDGLLVFSMKADATLDRRSLYGSCPVLSGEKWVATKWIHDKTY